VSHAKVVSSSPVPDNHGLPKSPGVKDSETGESDAGMGWQEPHHHLSSRPQPQQLEMFMQELSLEQYSEAPPTTLHHQSASEFSEAPPTSPHHQSPPDFSEVPPTSYNQAPPPVVPPEDES